MTRVLAALALAACASTVDPLDGDWSVRATRDGATCVNGEFFSPFDFSLAVDLESVQTSGIVPEALCGMCSPSLFPAMTVVRTPGAASFEVDIDGPGQFIADTFLVHATGNRVDGELTSVVNHQCTEHWIVSGIGVGAEPAEGP